MTWHLDWRRLRMVRERCGQIHPRGGYNPVCSVAIPGQPRCETGAVAHIRLWSRRYRSFVTPRACGEHLDRVRTAATFIQEHEFGGCCGMPGTKWDRELNCCVIDASGREIRVAGIRECDRVAEDVHV